MTDDEQLVNKGVFLAGKNSSSNDLLRILRGNQKNFEVVLQQFPHHFSYPFSLPPVTFERKYSL